MAEKRHEHIDISTYDDDPVTEMLAMTISEHHPEGRNMPIDACWTMARAAIWLDAAVLPSSMNELHILRERRVDDDGSVVDHWIPYIGINYWRRVGKERGGYEMFDARPMNVEEQRIHNLILPEDKRISTLDVASVVRVKAYTAVRRATTELGVKYWDYMAQAPQGIGVVTRAEMDSGHPPIGKTWRWVADKRAEADALRKEFPLMPNTGKSRYHLMYEQMLATIELSTEFSAAGHNRPIVGGALFPLDGKVHKRYNMPTVEIGEGDSANKMLFGFD